MRPGTLSLAAALLASCSTIPTYQDVTEPQPRRGAIEFHAGARQLQDEEWDEGVDLADQTVLGLAIAIPAQDAPVEGVLSYSQARSDDTIASGFGSLDVEATIGELSLGARYLLFNPSTERGGAYVGGGISWLDAELEVVSVTIDDSSIGAYVSGGGMWHAEALRFGVDLRYLVGSEFEDEGIAADPHYLQLGVFVGVLL